MSELIDNRAQRVRTLKGIIKRLHAGENPDEVRSSLKELVCQTDYSEVMAMRLATIFGPLRHFNLAHPLGLGLSSGFFF